MGLGGEKLLRKRLAMTNPERVIFWLCPSTALQQPFRGASQEYRHIVVQQVALRMIAQDTIDSAGGQEELPIGLSLVIEQHVIRHIGQLIAIMLYSLSS